MTYALRPIENGELPEIAQLHAACFPDDAWDSAALATILAMPGAEGRVACRSTELCGVLITQSLGDEAEILTLGVEPHLRRHGIARALLTDFFVRARGIGATRIMLEVAADNEAALALYRALGFLHQGTRRNYYRRALGATMDAWRLGLDIAGPRAG